MGQAIPLIVEPTCVAPTVDPNRLKVSPTTFSAIPLPRRSHGAFLLSVGWLGDAWDLYFNQLSERSVSTMVSFGPAWLAR